MHTEDIDRSRPTCFVFVVDQSGSMSDPFGGQVEGVSNPSKARGAADAVNRILKEMVIKCAKDEGVRDYIDIGIWGYGVGTGPLFLDGQNGLLPISQVDARARIES